MFKFKLKPLMTLRENQEETKKRELGHLNRQAMGCREKLKAIEEEKIDLESHLKHHMKGQLIPTEIQAYRRYLDQLRQQKKDLEVKLQQIEIQRLAKKEELKEAIKNRKILENLRERHMQIYLEEEKEIEQKRVDELISYKYTQKGQGEEDA